MKFQVKGVAGYIFNDSSGARLVTFGDNASAVNSITLANAATTLAPLISVSGSDTNIALDFQSQGTAGFNFFDSNGQTLFNITDVANSVNFLKTIPTSTGYAPALSVGGADNNIGIVLQTKGTQGVYFTDTNSQFLFVVNDHSSSPNYITVDNSATGFAPSFTASSSTDTNLGLNFNSKGTGGFVFQNTGGVQILNLAAVSTAANYLNITNAIAGSTPFIQSRGSDTNIGMTFQLKGSAANFTFQDSSANKILILRDVATPANYLQINNSGAGSAPLCSAQGTDTNINIQFQPKGSGVFSITSGVATTPAVSTSASLVIGTAYHNTAAYDVIVTVYLSITAATSASILLGVGTTSTPTQQTILSSFSTTGLISIPIYIPSGYYALLSTSGTITQTISGQLTMAV